MKKNRTKITGCSYAFRVEDIVRIYDEHARSGLSNREILRRYIWPKYHICEKTFYNIINASVDPRIIRRQEEMKRQLSLFCISSATVVVYSISYTLMPPGCENWRLVRRIRTVAHSSNLQQCK